MDTTPNQVIPPSAPTPPVENSTLAVPTGAKIVAVVFYILAILLLYASFSDLTIFNPLVGLATSSVLPIGLTNGLRQGLILALASLNLVAGMNLWAGKQSGKFLAISISALYFIFGLIKILKFTDATYIYTFISIIVNLLIIFYLLASHKIKNAFHKDSKVAMVALPILVIVIYLPIAVNSFQSKTKTQELINEIQDATKRSDQAIQQSKMDCKFYDYTTYDQRYAPISTLSGNGNYVNSTYGFQFNLPLAYTMKELRGSYTCEDDFKFYKPENTTDSGLLITVSVQPATGDLDFLFDRDYKSVENVQKTSFTLAGQVTLKITAGPFADWGGKSGLSYIFIYKNKLYTIVNSKNISDEQFNTAITSFQLTP
jgi:hypothetical protein